MTKGELIRLLRGFEDDVELQILIPAEEPYTIAKVGTDGEGVVFIIAATEA